ncbi:hypothetical protein AMTRI_Chr02g212830 [Amborella trichopoda]|uniref:GIR1-like zinc ribbon domain-containing protein n=1 Tax=Amborella trichopoda TaxID=13333 RepID=U5CXA8_AMBTC|nr:uncharacterized protein LOC18443064 [Amborella trichopoda]ERN14794.1 hypothetical protein AMTR_s00032p00067030 [Amborella trichopoda]|eukprot:XP_006853327.1 uncharacterized protein LOC18443064 [Amborella trichopoda]
MAADVSSLFQILNNKDEQVKTNDGKVLITRDLLGSKELDLDLEVPSGWEKRLDMKSGKIYLQKQKAYKELQDLNFPPCSNSTKSSATTECNSPLLRGEDSLLDLKLDLHSTSSTSTSPNSIDYQSVCTLEKVKSALERAGKESGKRPMGLNGTDGPSPSSQAMFAAGCPGCLLYVLISGANPKCPRCGTHVPCPNTKKPKLDLNTSLM